MIGLLGPNSAGKTTTFYMIVGLVNNDKGLIKLDDRDISLLPMHERARLGIGYLPQESSIFRKLTVRDNILAILETRKELSAAQREDKLDSLLEEFHISHIANSLGMSLSGGERRQLKLHGRWRLSQSLSCWMSPLLGLTRFPCWTSRRLSNTYASVASGYSLPTTTCAKP